MKGWSIAQCCFSSPYNFIVSHLKEVNYFYTITHSETRCGCIPRMPLFKRRPCDRYGVGRLGHNDEKSVS